MKSQAYDLDEMAIKIDGVSSKDLMWQAGKKIADFIKKKFTDKIAQRILT